MDTSVKVYLEQLDMRDRNTSLTYFFLLRTLTYPFVMSIKIYCNTIWTETFINLKNYNKPKFKVPTRFMPTLPIIYVQPLCNLIEIFVNFVLIIHYKTNKYKKMIIWLH